MEANFCEQPAASERTRRATAPMVAWQRRLLRALIQDILTVSGPESPERAAALERQDWLSADNIMFGQAEQAIDTLKAILRDFAVDDPGDLQDQDLGAAWHSTY